MQLFKSVGAAALTALLLVSGCSQSKGVSLSMSAQPAAASASPSSPPTMTSPSPSPSPSTSSSAGTAAASPSPTPAAKGSSAGKTSAAKPSASSAVAQAAVETDAAKCRQNPFAGMDDDAGYELKEKCVSVSGTVESVRKDQAGVTHINLKVLKSFKPLLNGKNNKDNKGFLMVDVIPLDQAAIPRPKIGANVTVIGAYVLDKQHGWMEIHPAWIVGDKGSADADQAAAEKTAASSSTKDQLTAKQNPAQ